MVDGFADCFHADAFSTGNFRLIHVEKIVRVDPFGLDVWQFADGTMKLLIRHLPLIDLIRRKRDKDGIMLDPIVPIQGKVSSISVDLALIIELFSLGFLEDLSDLIIDHDKTVILIKRVYFPQINLFHFHSPSRCWLVSGEQEGGGGLRHLGETRQPALFIWL